MNRTALVLAKTRSFMQSTVVIQYVVYDDRRRHLLQASFAAQPCGIKLMSISPRSGCRTIVLLPGHL
ncbi:hypothetical protein SCLCIDRAFT_1208653 [Scleroderma citrinum Foug A]|uniref:Uncharacterized protein n=1 Tax=Scleroderma citrinum Foug A TaxID=1036808 RepID=A0A0C3EN09_9AGAM|nr:hypothetical protein SCLCIDRAFT_1208653 [Scleroderma citrinum Foug A]